MNIISSTCIGGHIYKQTNQEYTNPFIWLFIDYESMKQLMLNFYKINYMNISISENENFSNTYILNIDNLINLQYIHYKQNDLFITPVIKYNNVCVKDAKQYVIDKYMLRVEKMLNKKEPPIFVVGVNPYLSQNQILDLAKLQIDYPYKFIGLINDKNLTYLKSNIEILSNETKSPDAHIKADYILKNSHLIYE